MRETDTQRNWNNYFDNNKRPPSNIRWGLIIFIFVCICIACMYMALNEDSSDSDDFSTADAQAIDIDVFGYQVWSSTIRLSFFEKTKHNQPYDY